MASTLELLKRCSQFYHSGELTAGCLSDPRPCARVPRECVTHNAVYTILHYLTDHDFMSPYSVSFYSASNCQGYVMIGTVRPDLPKMPYENI